MTKEIVEQDNAIELKKYEIDKKFEVSQNIAEKKLAMSALIRVGDSDLSVISLLADKFSRAGDMVPRDYQGNPEKCFAAIYKGATLGLDAFTSLSQIAVINGRATIWGDTALALVRNSGLLVKFKEEIVTKGNKLIAICTVQRKGEEESIEEYCQSDAELAGLWGKNVWAKHPKRMLKYKARAFALRDTFPDVLQGLHFKEEMEGEDFRDVTPEQAISNETIDTIDTMQGLELVELIKEKGKDEKTICEIYGINTIIDLPSDKFEILKNSLNAS